ncbi:hypothetical protein MLD38_032876 [Melastoma candidum]|uniref:Uncharacterized protein n=1 Tax=Melastoma candidum TaxID=119954 RepID=A0ACB9M4Y3_9MYRT|nr:hypothetical protein MLD38_032876 [Melastoma candidum]
MLNHSAVRDSDNNNSWAAAATRTRTGTGGNSCSSCSSTTAPSWLLCTLADLEERMKALAFLNPEEDEGGDTFAQRAESYYRTRPQLLFLLQDLYKSFLYLSERYAQALSKQNGGHSRLRALSASAALDDNSCLSDKEDDGSLSHVDFSDAESSLSYQNPKGTNGTWIISDGIVVELVMKNVEQDIIMHELEMVDRRCEESSRKMSLQRSLLEVLESERMILLHENGRLGYKVSALMEENQGLVSESVYVKRMAGELARCMIKMREDQRVSMLSRRIEDLQGQVQVLEKKNKEYYKQLTGRERDACKQRKGDREVTLEACLQLGKPNLKEDRAGKDGGNNQRPAKWWERIKRMDIFMCGIQTDIR